MAHVHFNTVKARKLREDATPAEDILWSYLRSKRHFPNHHFRRQKPIAPYIIDFYCHSAKLVIELDGSVHTSEAQRRYDFKRTRYLEAKGLKVMRFWNGDVVYRPEKVLKIILSHLSSQIASSAI